MDTGCYYVLATVNDAALNTVMQLSLQDNDFISFRKIPFFKVGIYYQITELHGSVLLIFLKNLHAVFH